MVIPKLWYYGWRKWCVLHSVPSCVFTTSPAKHLLCQLDWQGMTPVLTRLTPLSPTLHRSTTTIFTCKAATCSIPNSSWHSRLEKSCIVLYAKVQTHKLVLWQQLDRCDTDVCLAPPSPDTVSWCNHENSWDSLEPAPTEPSPSPLQTAQRIMQIGTQIWQTSQDIKSCQFQTVNMCTWTYRRIVFPQTPIISTG